VPRTRLAFTIRLLVALLYCVVLVGAFTYLSDFFDTAGGDQSALAGRGGVVLKTDFPSYYYGSVALSVGGNPYDVRLLDSLAHADGVDSPVYPYLYPPVFASLARPLVRYSPLEAEGIWTVTGVLLSGLVLCLALFLRVREANAGDIVENGMLSERLFSSILAVLLLVLLPFRQNLEWGQVNILVLSLMLCALLWCDSKKGEWLAGLCIALAAMIKVTPALLVVFFLIRGKRGAVYGFFVGSLLLVALSVLLDGWSPWVQFMEFSPSMGYGRNIEGLFHPSIVTNFSLSGFWMRALEGSGPLMRLVAMFSALTLFVLLLFVGLKTRGVRNTHLLVLPFTVLMVIVSPLAWRHHLVYLFPGLFLLVRHMAWETGRKGRWIWIAGILVLASASALDLSVMYRQVPIPEMIRPVATSLNLLFLLGLLFASLTYVYRRARSPAGAVHPGEPPLGVESHLPENRWAPGSLHPSPAYSESPIRIRGNSAR
jgi:hypothetical protein